MARFGESDPTLRIADPQEPLPDTMMNSKAGSVVTLTEEEIPSPLAPTRCSSRGPTDVAVKRPLDEHRQGYFERRYRMDRAIGCVLLVVSSPVTLVLCALVRLTSRGPALYRQERLGLNGEPFEILKLRSMVQDAEKDGEAVWCVKNDARVTPLGRVLRKLHLDELPQLINVARGEMSLIGPRPERPQICQRLARDIDDYYRRVTVKPGVTGLAQINLPPDETLEDAMRKQVLDLRYIEEANAWLDCRMLAATMLRMVGIKGEVVIRSMRLCRRDLVRDGKFESVRVRAVEAVDEPADEPQWDELQSTDGEFAVAGGKRPSAVAASASPAPRRPR